MKRAYSLTVLASMVMLMVTGAHAATVASTPSKLLPEDEVLAIGKRESHVRLVLMKDPTLAAILSAGTPGVGQIYAGRWQRGLAFMGGITAAAVAIVVAGSDMDLSVSDYDYNGDGIVNTNEYDAWKDKPYKDFTDMSAARQTVVLGGAATALAVYVWNIIDAYDVAKEHNRKLYRELSNISLGFGVDQRGRTAGKLSIAF